MLRKAVSDRKLSVCLCKNVVYNWIDIFGAETSCEEIENQVKCYKKRKPTVSRALFRSVFDCIEWGSITAIRGNLPHPPHPPNTHKYHGFHRFHIFHVLTG